MTAHCHVAVRKVAMKAAGELYESLMGDNGFYETWKKQNPGASSKELERRFVLKNWGKCLDFARKTMVLMLRDPGIPEDLKEEILEILTMDQLLTRGRGRIIQ